METLLHDLHSALRLMRKAPGFTLIAVLVLALAIGANTVIFSLVEGFLLHPLPVRDPARLVWLTERSPQVRNLPIAFPDLDDLQQQTHAFSGVAGLTAKHVTLLGRGPAQPILGEGVTANFFSVMGVEPELGRAFQDSDDHPGAAPVVVLSHRLWTTQLGADPHILGKELNLGGKDYTIVGVMPARFRLNLGIALFVPLHEEMSAALQRDRGAHVAISAVGRLQPGVPLDQAKAAMAALSRRLQAKYPATNAGISVTVEPLRRFLTGALRPALLLLMGAVGLVLLIACANLASLLLARSLTRRKEIAIRLAMGAARPRLARQLLTETIVLALLGGALGIALAQAGMRLALTLLPAHLPLANQVGLNLPTLLFTLTVAIGTGLLFGLAPALQATRTDINRTLIEGGRQSARGGHQRLNRALVVGEIALTLVLLVGAGLLLRSFRQLRQVNPGFDPEGVITAGVNLPATDYATPVQQSGFYQRLLHRLGTMPGIASAGAIRPLPFVSGGWRTAFAVEGRPAPRAGNAPETDLGVVTPAYFHTMRIPLLRGRAFTSRDNASAMPVAIVDESFVRRYWPHQNPIGQHLKVDTGNFGDAAQPVLTVVGVVGHTMNYGLDGTRRVETYLPYLQRPVGDMTLVVRAKRGNESGLALAMRKAVQSVDADQPVYDIRPMQRVVAASLAARRLALDLLSALSALALLLAAVGLYGIIAWSVAQRTQEIGIRMALGADRGTVLGMIVREGLQLAGLGIGLGLCAGLLLSRTMSSLLYGVRSDDPITYATLSMALLAVALLAAWLPALRATRVDPVIALRGE